MSRGAVGGDGSRTKATRRREIGLRILLMGFQQVTRGEEKTVEALLRQPPATSQQGGCGYLNGLTAPEFP